MRLPMRYTTNEINKNQLNAAINFGLQVQFIKQDECLHRVGTRLKPNSKNGWYIAFNDFLVMGDWQTGMTETFRADMKQQTRKDRQRIKECIERNKQEKKALQIQTAVYANQTFRNAAHAVVHPYLSHKGIEAATDLKLDRGQLLVPLYDLISERVENLQRIFPDGTKRFMKNGRIKGLCCPYGMLNRQAKWPKGLTKIFICEGFATAASINQMTNLPVLAAMNANNLLSIAKQALKKWPGIELIIAGDDDYLTEQQLGINPGKKKAYEVASALDLKVSFPPFSPEQKRAGLSDWNDYYVATRREVS